MQLNTVSAVFICIGIVAVLYFLYYVATPIIASVFFVLKKYAVFKFEDGFYWVKISKDDKDFYVYQVDLSKSKRYRDLSWQLYHAHKKAYRLYLEGREADERKSN